MTLTVVVSPLLSATDEAWRLLASYLERFPSANIQNHRCVIHKLLSHGVPLPDWLVKSYKVKHVGTSRPSQAFIVKFPASSHHALLC